MGLDLSKFTGGSTGGDFEPIPAGTYLVDIADSTLKEYNGVDKLSLQLAVVGPKHKNRRLFTDFPFTENGAGRLYVFLVSSGIVDPDDPEDVAALQDFEPMSYEWQDGLRDVQLKVDVVVDEYNGKARNKVARFYKPTEDDLEKLSLS